MTMKNSITKKKLIATCSCLLLSVFLQADASKQLSVQPKESQPYDTLSSWYAIGGGRYLYSEPHVMSVRGPFGAVSGSYVWRKNKDVFYKLNGEMSYIDGFYRSQGTGYAPGDVSSTISVEAVTGRRWSSFFMTIGMGVRYLYNDAVDLVTNTGHRGYLREQWYYYLPINCVYEQPLMQNQILSIGLGSKIFLQGRNITTISYEKSYDQGKGSNLNAFVAYSYRDYQIKLAMEKWHVSDSVKICQANWCSWEPFNNTWQFGLHIGKKF